MSTFDVISPLIDWVGFTTIGTDTVIYGGTSDIGADYNLMPTISC